MLKLDARWISELSSQDESVRIHAATRLKQLEIGHFEVHKLDFSYVQQRVDTLLSAYRATQSPLVREWIFQVFLWSKVFGDNIDAVALEALQPDCPYLSSLLGYILYTLSRLPEIDARLGELATHPDPQVRWRCASGFYSLGLAKRLTNPIALSAVRTLLLDDFQTARTYATLAMQTFRTLHETDRKLLEQVAELNDQSSSEYARELLAKHFPSPQDTGT